MFVQPLFTQSFEGRAEGFEGAPKFGREPLTVNDDSAVRDAKAEPEGIPLVSKRSKAKAQVIDLYTLVPDRPNGQLKETFDPFSIGALTYETDTRIRRLCPNDSQFANGPSPRQNQGLPIVVVDPIGRFPPEWREWLGHDPYGNGRGARIARPLDRRLTGGLTRHSANNQIGEDQSQRR
jgi:hypothetical protein